MHVDSRNPVVYYSGLQVTANNGKYAFSHLRNTDIDNYEIQLITSAMYIDKFDVRCYEDQYVSLADYDKIKAKLENLERKHAKLQRRHDTLGQKYVILNQGFEGLLYRVKIMEGL
jgi:hypothetical protein